MSRVFVDTSGLLAVLDEGDPNHDRAVTLLGAALEHDEAITHSYIHVEAEQLVRRRLGAAAAARLLAELLPAMRTVWVDETTHAAAAKAVRRRGRAVSLVDQVSFIIMRGMEVDSALAFDAEFEREGYRLPGIGRHRSLSETPAAYVTSPQTGDLVSVAELAARSGRSVNTIQSWRRRHPDFPAPHAELAAGPIWLWRDVRAWIDRRPRRNLAAAR